MTEQRRVEDAAAEVQAAEAAGRDGVLVDSWWLPSATHFLWLGSEQLPAAAPRQRDAA